MMICLICRVAAILIVAMLPFLDMIRLDMFFVFDAKRFTALPGRVFMRPGDCPSVP